MSQQEIMRALRSDAQHSKLKSVPDHVLLYRFVQHLLDSFVAATDHPDFGSIVVKPYMVDAIVGNIMMNN